MRLMQEACQLFHRFCRPALASNLHELRLITALLSRRSWADSIGVRTPKDKALLTILDWRHLRTSRVVTILCAMVSSRPGD